MSLRDNYVGRGGSYSGAGWSILSAGQGTNANEVSVEEVMEQQRLAGRVDLLNKELPDLAYSNPTLIAELAQSGGDDDDMMQAAAGAMDTVTLNNMLTHMKGLSKEEQRGTAANMPQAVRGALETAGWQVPEEKGGGFFGAVKGVATGTLRVGGKGIGAATAIPGVKQILGGFDYLGEEAGRVNRVAPTSQSSKDLLQQTGMTAEQLQQQTGIEAIGEDVDSNLMDTGLNPVGAISSLLGGKVPEIAKFAINPGDLWKAVQIYKEVGHEGDDDILAQTQYEVYTDLDEAFGNIETAPSAKEMLRWAKRLTEGMTIQDLAEEEGLQGADAEGFIQKVGMISTTDGFRNAMSKLESGRMSAGRNVARLAWNNPTLDTSKGGAKWVSGSYDALYTVVADPTLVAGKVSKSVKLARWGFRAGEGADKLDRWQTMIRALNKVDDAKALDDVAKRAAAVEEASKELVDVAGGSRRYLKSAVSEAEAVRRPALVVQEVLKTGNVGPLIRQYPAMMKHFDEMVQYNEELKRLGLTTMEADASQVMEYFKMASGNRNIVGAGRGARMKSTKVFGHDGNGHLVVPHTTAAQRGKLMVGQNFRRVAFGQLDEIPQGALDEMKAVDDEAAKDAAKALGKSDEEIAEQAERMHVNKWTGAYEVKPPNRVQEGLHKLYKLVTEKVPEQGFVHLEGEDALGDFSKLNETLGFIEGANLLERAARLNRFAFGSTLERHLLVNEMIGKMADAAGITVTKEGNELIERYVANSNHIYGFGKEAADLVGAQGSRNLASDLERKFGRHAILEKQLAEGIAVPSMKEMLVAARREAGLRRVGMLYSGYARKGLLEAGMSRVWKPSVVMRISFPMRAGFDEAIQHMMRTGVRGYLKTAVLEKWAGINQFEVVGGGLKAIGPQGAIKPVRSFTRMMSTMTNGHVEAVERLAMKELAQDSAFIAIKDNPVAVKKMLVEKAKGSKKIKKIPRTFRAIDDFAWGASLVGSKAFHAITMDSKILSLQAWSEFILKHGSDYETTIKNRKLFAVTPIGQQEMAENIGATFNALRSTEASIPGMELRYDPSSPSNYQAIAMKKDPANSYSWAGNGNISAKYANLSHWMQAMAQSPSSRAAMHEMSHFVPQNVLDEVGGLDALQELRSLASSNPTVRSHFAHAVNSEADSESIIASLAENGIDDAAEYQDLLRAWDELSPDARYFVTDDRLQSDLLTDNWEVTQDRAANGIYNAFRTLDNQSNLRSMIRTQVVDGKTVAETLKRNHTRLYAPMVDRRVAEDLVRMFQDETMAQAFAEALERHLKEKNLSGEFAAIWQGAPPGPGGYDLATWMAGLKGNIIQGDTSYISAMMAGSSNPALAEAMRDAIGDVLPDAMLRPTIGYVDYPNGLVGHPHGVQRISDSTVAMQPQHASTLRPIDADNVVRQVHVRMADDREMWVGETELDQIGRVARMDKVATERVNKQRTMLRWNKDSGKVTFDSKLIDDDFKDGMKFLRGEGGTYKRTKAGWGWTDPTYTAKANELETILNNLGLADNTGLELQDLVGLYRTRQLREAPLPLEGVMRDNDLWDDFEELAGTASKGATKRTVEQWTDDVAMRRSKVVKAALDDLNIDVDQLGFRRKDYKKFLIEREKAHHVLDPAGFGRPSGVSREAIEREKDALSIAFQRSGVDISDELRDRFKIAIGKEKNDYTVLGEIWGTGVPEDAATRKAAHDVLAEVNHVFVSEKSGKVHTNLMSPLLRGEFTQDMLWRKVALNDLPHEAFGPTMVLGEQNKWEALVGRFFQGYAEPAIGAISRTPMWNDAFDKAMETYSHVYSNQVNKALDERGIEILGRMGITPDQLEDMNHLVFRQLKNDPKFAEDVIDPVTDYARALNADDINGARAQLSLLAEKDGHLALSLTDQEMADLRGWHRMHAAAKEAQVERAAYRATDMIKPFIDDHRIRSGFQELMGPLFLPFFYAEEQFFRRFARGLYETPHMLRRGQMVMNGMRNIGVVRQDAQGNEIFVVPGSEVFTGKLADLATMITGNEAFQVLDQPLSGRTEFAMPGWTADSNVGFGPLVGLTKTEIGRRYPELGWVSDRDMNRKSWEWLMPSSVVNGYKSFIGDPDPAQTTTAQLAAISFLEANGKGLPEDATATEREEFLQDVRQVSRMVGVMRWATGQLNVTSLSPIDQEEIYRKEFTDLLAMGMDYDEALSSFIAMNGPEDLKDKVPIQLGQAGGLEVDTSALTLEELKRWNTEARHNLVYTVFRTENETGAPLPATSAAYKFMLENGDLLTDYPESAVWLMPQEQTNDLFDRKAYNEQITLGLRSQRAPTEVLDQMFIKMASEEYYTKKGEHDLIRQGLATRRDAAKGGARTALAEAVKQEDAIWDNWKSGYLNQHPVFQANMGPEASERRVKTIDNLEWMIAANMGGEQGKVLKPLLDKFTEFQRQYEALGGQSSKAAKEVKAKTFDTYYTDMLLMVQDDPRLKDFWYSVLEPELPNRADTLESAAKLTVAKGA